MIGMNPRHARANIESIAEWHDRKFSYYFFEVI